MTSAPRQPADRSTHRHAPLPAPRTTYVPEPPLGTDFLVVLVTRLGSGWWFDPGRHVLAETAGPGGRRARRPGCVATRSVAGMWHQRGPCTGLLCGCAAITSDHRSCRACLAQRGLLARSDRPAADANIVSCGEVPTQKLQIVPARMPVTCTSSWMPRARAAYRTAVPARVFGLKRAVAAIHPCPEVAGGRAAGCSARASPG